MNALPSSMFLQSKSKDITPRYMSGFKGRVKTDISPWHATKYATITQWGDLILLITHSGIFGDMPPRYVCFALSLVSRHRCTPYSVSMGPRSKYLMAFT